MENKKQCFSTQISIFLLSIILLLSFVTPAFAQLGTAVAFLKISPSPQANAMGQTYGNIISTSPMATIFNPASLGFFAQKNYIGKSYYPQKVELFPTSDIDYNAGSTNIGINLNNFINIPISFGVAFHNVRVNLGEQDLTGEHNEPIGTFSSWEEVKGTTFSIALDYYIRISFGYTQKNIESHFAPIVGGEAKADAHDIGLLFQLPVYELLRESNIIQNYKFYNVEPYFDPGFYYSKTNIGDKITYGDDPEAYPLPRNLSLGINLNTGLVYKGRYNSFNIFSFKWAREVDDILVKVNEDNTADYVSGLHDIKFWDNLIIGKSNDKIITKRGHELNFGDFYFIRKGKYENIPGRVILKTEGWGINYTQPIKILTTLLNLDDNKIIRLISNINFEKHYSKTDYGHPFGVTEFKSYVIRLKNFPLN